VVCAAGTASAQNRWYVEGSAGAQLRDSITGSTALSNGLGASASGRDTITYAPGIVANLGLGYKLPFGFRVEGELGYAHYLVSSHSPYFTANGFQPLNGSSLALVSGGAVDQGTATVNAFYDLPVSGGLIPYIGGGFGGSLSGSQPAQYSSPGGVVRLNEPGGSSYIWPVILGQAGLTIAYSDSWALVPSYRFQHVFAGAFPYNENIFKLGVRYSW
jgi:opacity protein-like surface antigen